MKKPFATMAVLAAFFALPAAAAPISLADLSAYFAGIRTAEAPFTQYNADGTEVTGRLFMHRPGRARFEYDNSDVLVVVGGERKKQNIKKAQ
jgi:outer membrane lipoprotein-sorting protein